MFLVHLLLNHHLLLIHLLLIHLYVRMQIFLLPMVQKKQIKETCCFNSYKKQTYPEGASEAATTFGVPPPRMLLRWLPEDLLQKKKLE